MPESVTPLVVGGDENVRSDESAKHSQARLWRAAPNFPNLVLRGIEVLDMAVLVVSTPDDDKVAQNEAVKVPTQLTHAPVIWVHKRGVEFSFGIDDPVSRAWNHGLHEPYQTSLAIPPDGLFYLSLD